MRKNKTEHLIEISITDTQAKAIEIACNESKDRDAKMLRNVLNDEKLIDERTEESIYRAACVLAFQEHTLYAHALWTIVRDSTTLCSTCLIHPINMADYKLETRHI